MSEVVVVTAVPEPADEISEYLDWSADFMLRWSDAIELDGSMPRMSISGPISELQTLRREVNALDVNDRVLADVHSHLIRSVDYSVDAFLAFAANTGGESKLFESAAKEMELYTTGVANQTKVNP